MKYIGIRIDKNLNGNAHIDPFMLITYTANTLFDSRTVIRVWNMWFTVTVYHILIIPHWDIG